MSQAISPSTMCAVRESGAVLLGSVLLRSGE